MTRSRGKTLVACLWLLPVSVFGYFSVAQPWDAADQALAYLGPGPRLVVAMTFDASLRNPSTGRRRRQAYIAVPDSLRTLNVYEVVRDGTMVRVEIIPFGVVIIGGFYAAWIGVSIWYLLHREAGTRR